MKYEKWNDWNKSGNIQSLTIAQNLNRREGDNAQICNSHSVTDEVSQFSKAWIFPTVFSFC